MAKIRFDASHLSPDNRYLVPLAGGPQSPLVETPLYPVADAPGMMQMDAGALNEVVQIISLRDGKRRLAGLGRPGMSDRVWGPTITASTLIALHQQMLYISDDPTVSQEVAQVIEGSDGFNALVATIKDLGDDWCKTKDVTDEDGKPIIDPETEEPYYVWDLHPQVVGAVEKPVLSSLALTQSDTEFQSYLWDVQDGIPSEYCQKVSLDEASGYIWRLQNKTPKHGLELGDLQICDDLPAGTWAAEDILRGQDLPDGAPLPELSLTVGDATRALSLHGVLGQGRTAHTVGGASVSLTARGGARPRIDLELRNAPMGATAELSAASGTQTIALRDVSGGCHLSLTVANKYIRHLSAHVQFLNTADTPFNPAGWDEVLPEFIRDFCQPDDTKKFARTIPKVQTLAGIPVHARDTEIAFYFPAEAAKVRFLMGTWGTGQYDPDVCRIGLMMTLLIDLALPIILAAAGSGPVDEEVVNDCTDNQELFNALVSAGKFLLGPTIEAKASLHQDPSAVVIAFLDAIAQVIIKGPLREYLKQKLESSFLGKCIPLLNLAMQIYDTAQTIAVVAQTTHAILSSPYVFRVEASRSMNATCQLHPDPDTKEFPWGARHCRVTYLYDSDATFQTYDDRSWAGAGTKKPFDLTVKDLPAGGRIKAVAELRTSKGWVAAQGETDWIEAVPTDHLLDLGPLTLKSNAVPISDKTKLSHKARLTNDKMGKLFWDKTAEPPTATRRDLDPTAKVGLTELTGFTLSQPNQALGLSYRANGLHLPDDDPNRDPSDKAMYRVSNISTSKDPVAKAAASGIGFTMPTGIEYLLLGGDSAGWFVDASNPEFDPEENPTGGYHLRRIDLSGPPDFDKARKVSYGRFSCMMEDFALHPSGYLCGIHCDDNKLGILRVALTPCPDAEVEVAQLLAGDGARPGLVREPRSIAISGDGRFLVLEDLNQRIQAFDISGNPVPCFDGQPFFDLHRQDGHAHLLAHDVDPSGYVFVAGYIAQGDDPQDYFLDIYDDTGAHLCRNYGFNAGRIAVTKLRNIYALNFEGIKGKDMKVHPSVSYWAPNEP